MRSMPHPRAPSHRFARLLCARPTGFILALTLLGALATWAASGLTINSNQLDLINQDLREVKDVKRIIDMVGGSGFLMLALRSEDEAKMKRVADDLAASLSADSAHVRAVTYRMPVQFIQDNIGLFVDTEDLKTLARYEGSVDLLDRGVPAGSLRFHPLG